MPDIEIVKLKLRRGTDAQRESVVLEQGELGYTTDSKRVFVGDGFLSGGNVLGAKNHPPMYVGTRTDLAEAVTGDMVYEDNLLYQLSGTDATMLSAWTFVGTRTDGTTLDYTGGLLELKDGGITIDKVASDFVVPNGGIELTTTGLSAAVDNATITINASGQLESTNINISAGDVGLGLSGGAGDPIGVDVTEAFTFTSGKLDFAAAGTDTVDGDAIQAAALGEGLEKSGSTIRLETIGGGTISPFNTSEFDSKGRVTASIDTIEQNLSGTSTTGGGEIFFGSMDAADPGNEVVVTALSGNGAGGAVTISLSSAGFMQIASGTNGNFAIPVFKF